MTSPSDKLGLLFWLFMKAFWWSRNAFCDKFRFSLLCWNFWFTLLRNLMSKSRENDVAHSLSVTLGRRVCFRSQDLMFVGSAFQFGFLQSKPWFPVIELNSGYTEANPHWIGSFPVDGSKTGFRAVHRLICSWTREWNNFPDHLKNASEHWLKINEQWILLNAINSNTTTKPSVGSATQKNLSNQ